MWQNPRMSVLQRAADELGSRDPVLAALIDRFGYPTWGRKPRMAERFETLAEAICYQQLSGKAAATIWSRTVDAIGGHATPAAFLSTPMETLRSAGLSNNKALALLDLSAHVADGRVDLSSAGRRNENTVIDELIQVRGIGLWTAEMFLISALHRMDVWSTRDLGIRKGYAAAYGLADVPTAHDLEPLGDPFRPYRSVASHYFWAIADN